MLLLSSSIIQNIVNPLTSEDRANVLVVDDSLRKSLYIATDCVMKKWTAPISNLGITLSQLTIKFKERIENIYKLKLVLFNKLMYI